MRLLRFVTRDGSYTFPAQSSGSLVFGDVKPSTKALAGLDGGFDEYRTRRAPQSVGNIRANWWINPNDRKSITKEKDAALKMNGWGTGLLFIQPEDYTDVKRDVRWCTARINNLQMSENVSDLPHLRQQVTANFQVSDPGWYGVLPNSNDPSSNAGKWWCLNDGLKLNAGLKVGGPRRSVTLANGGTVTVTNNGSRPTRPLIKITGVGSAWLLGAGVTLGDPTLFLDGAGSPNPNIGMRRLSYANNTVVEEFKWFGAILSTETLVIDCAKFKVTQETSRGDMNVYSGFVVTQGFGFFEIPPGTHTLQLFGTFSTTATVTIWYRDSWY